MGRFQTPAGERVRPYLYEHRGEAMVRHVLRVASGLDSMVLGEPQIFGQLKSAFAVAEEAAEVEDVIPASFGVSISPAPFASLD